MARKLLPQKTLPRYDMELFEHDTKPGSKIRYQDSWYQDLCYQDQGTKILGLAELLIQSREHRGLQAPQRGLGAGSPTGTAGGPGGSPLHTISCIFSMDRKIKEVYVFCLVPLVGPCCYPFLVGLLVRHTAELPSGSSHTCGEVMSYETLEALMH